MSVLPSTTTAPRRPPAPVVRTRALHAVPGARRGPAVVVAPDSSCRRSPAGSPMPTSTTPPRRPRSSPSSRRSTGRSRPTSVHRGAGYASRLTSTRVRAGSRRGRRLRRGPPGRRGGLHEHDDRLVGRAVQGPAEPHDHLRLRHRAPLDAAPVGPLPHRAPARPQTVEDAALPPRRGARRAPVAAPARRRRGRLQRDRRDLARRALRAIAHDHGARIAVDAAQLSAHRPIDLAAWDADYVAFSGPQDLRPVGAACSPADPTGSTQARRTSSGGGATRSVTDESTTWATGPARHEGGSPNVLGAIAIAAAASAIRRHREAIEAHEAPLLDPPPRRASTRSGRRGAVHLRGRPRPGRRRRLHHRGVGLLPRVAGLSVEHGIGVRDGKFCAHLLVDELLDDPWGERPSTAVRASIGLGSTDEARRAPHPWRRLPRRPRHRGHVDQGRARLGHRGRRPPRRRGRASLVTSMGGRLRPPVCRWACDAAARRRRHGWVQRLRAVGRA